MTTNKNTPKSGYVNYAYRDYGHDGMENLTARLADIREAGFPQDKMDFNVKQVAFLVGNVEFKKGNKIDQEVAEAIARNMIAGEMMLQEAHA